MREHFVVSSIRSHEVARAKRSGVRVREDALKALDVDNSLLGVHWVSISNISVAVVKRAALPCQTGWQSYSLPTPSRIKELLDLSPVFSNDVLRADVCAPRKQM
jgi:hypothetical protein